MANVVDIIDSSRVLALPYKCIGKLYFKNNGELFYGTAYIIRGSIILTAAHNIYRHQTGTYSSNFVFCPAYYKDNTGKVQLPFGRWIGIGDKIMDNFFNTRGNAQYAYDIGLILVVKEGHMQSNDTFQQCLRVVENNIEANTALQDVGYANNIYRGNAMCSITANFSHINNRTLAVRHGNELERGTSGGPWILSTGSNEHVAIGVHSCRPNGVAVTYSPYFSRQILQWINYNVDIIMSQSIG